MTDKERKEYIKRIRAENKELLKEVIILRAKLREYEHK